MSIAFLRRLGKIKHIRLYYRFHTLTDTKTTDDDQKQCPLTQGTKEGIGEAV